MKKVLVLALALSIPFAAGGCRRLTRSVTEKAIEEGTGAKNVDLDKGNITVVGKDGQKVSIGQGAVAPSDWPSAVPIYPGTKLMTTASTPDGWIYTGTSTDDSSKIMSFYKDKLSSYKTEATVNMGTMQMMSFKGTDNDVQVTSGANSGNAKENVVSVTISKHKK